MSPNTYLNCGLGNQNNQVFITKNSENSDNVYTILKNVRIKHPKKITIATLNINSLGNKFEQLKTIMGNIDIIILIETKLDDTFPTSQLIIEGYSKPYMQNQKK